MPMFLSSPQNYLNSPQNLQITSPHNNNSLQSSQKKQSLYYHQNNNSIQAIEVPAGFDEADLSGGQPTQLNSHAHIKQSQGKSGNNSNKKKRKKVWVPATSIRRLGLNLVA
mmetsp:Transcript_14687/g.25006  ORF Transcript_14687/g.25006 Transcript_14687/m.25006 type:complete len:111 (-) Transcript_14687:16-348(-)